MSKGLKQILAAVIVIAVFGLGILILSIVMPEESADPDSSASPTNAAPVYYLVKEDAEQLASIENIYSDESRLLVSFEKDEDGRMNYNVTPAAEFFPYNTSKFRSMMFTLTSLTAMNVIDSDPEDLSIYGLDEPQFQVVLTMLDGKSITVSIGDPTPVDSNFYAMTDQDNSVYIMGNYLATLIMRSELEYRDITTFPQYTDEEIYTNINRVTMTKRDGTVIDIMLDMELEHSGNIASSAYVMLSPTVSSCSDDIVQEKVLDVVSTLTFIGIAGDITKDELTDYGFDKPARLRMTDISGNEIDLTIGSVSADSRVYYAAITEQYEACVEEDIYLTLLTYSPSAFTWLDISYVSLMNRAVWLQSIHDVESIEYDMDGKSYHIELFRYDDVTGSGVDVVRTEGILNDKAINETNTKRLFGRTLNMREIDSIPAGTDLGNPQYTITMKLLDGSIRTLELVKINERQFACIVDGTAEFYVYQSNIQNLTTALERLMDDRDVPLVYYT